MLARVAPWAAAAWARSTRWLHTKTRTWGALTDAWKLSPLLVLYLAVVFAAADSQLVGDEGRYVMYARNLLAGHYSPLDRVYIWNGPGYPLVLVPFLLLGVPLFAAKALNALLLFIAVLYFRRALADYLEPRHGLLASWALGLYPLLYSHVYLLLTESLTILLITGFAYHLTASIRPRCPGRSGVVLASLYLGFLALTKVIFGYVIVVGTALSLGIYLITRAPTARRSLIIGALALAACSPYLAYTYSITGKVFHWAEAGGLSFYGLSSPYEGEYGDYGYDAFAADPALLRHHQGLLDHVAGMDEVARDEAFKAQAIANIKAHPGRFAANWVANVSRMMFDYPWSARKPDVPALYVVSYSNMFVFVLCCLCVYPTIRRWRQVPAEIRAVLGFGLISLGASSLVSAGPRQFLVLVPVLCLWICFTMARLLQVTWREPT